MTGGKTTRDAAKHQGIARRRGNVVPARAQHSPINAEARVAAGLVHAELSSVPVPLSVASVHASVNSVLPNLRVFAFA